MLRKAATTAATGLDLWLARSLATTTRAGLHTTAIASSSRFHAASERKPRADTGRNAPNKGKPSGKAVKPFKQPKEGPAPRNADGSALYPLKPNVLSARLKQLCEENNIDGAVNALKSAPADAQNTPVWNTIIWECMKARKYSLAYKLYVDMKRRGFRPTIRTFSTMLSGYSRMPAFAWKANHKQLENVHSLYSNLVAHVEQLQRSGKVDLPELEYLPLARASYIQILGDAGLHQRVFDAYYAMDQSGPLAPDRVVYTACFKALSSRKVEYASSSPEEVDEYSDDEGGSQRFLTPGAARAQNASDAKMLWNQMLKVFATNTQRNLGERYSIDSHLLAEALSVLARGRPTDQNFALDLVREYLQLAAPGEDVGSTGEDASRNPAIEPLTAMPPLLTTHTLNAALTLANEMRRYRLTTQLFQQVVDLEDSIGAAARGRSVVADVHSSVPSVLDRGHAEHVLRAYSSLPREAGQALETLRWMLRRAALGEHRLRPTPSSYALVLVAAWRSGDWSVATAAWELMTGYRAKSFADGRAPDAPERERVSRGKGLHFEPDAEHASALAKTALAAKRETEVMRVCLRMLDTVGVRGMLPGKKDVPDRNVDSAPDMDKPSRRREFYGVKLAEVLIQLVDGAVPAVGKGTPTPTKTAEQTGWLALAAQARAAQAKAAWQGESPPANGPNADPPAPRPRPRSPSRTRGQDPKKERSRRA